VFNPFEPEVLQFDGKAADSRLVGFDYYERTTPTTGATTTRTAPTAATGGAGSSATIANSPVRHRYICALA
jgi:hypothetical protein